MSDRIAELRAAATAAGTAGLALRLPENVLLATGYWPQLAGLGVAIVPVDADPVLIVPEYERAEAAQVWPGAVRTVPVVRLDGEPTGDALARSLKEFAVASGIVGEPIGFEDSYEILAPPAFLGETFAVAAATQRLWQQTLSSPRLVGVTAAVEEIKAIKTAADLERLDVTNAIAGKGMDAFRHAARPGATEVEVAAAVESAISTMTGAAGARVGRGFATVTSGPATDLGWQYFRSSDRVLEDGDWVILELGTVVDGYWADHTRTVVAGTATREQRDMFAADRSACEAALAACRPGASGGEVDATSRRACVEAGFEQFPHHTGHGVGFRYHETSPPIVPGAEDILAANMVVAVEPGIYGPGIGGVRWEDDAVVGPDGARPLIESDYGLD